ncbi:hypothetical protein L249_5866 [Ophiocordyceps polyrhachis-furcata BCC 54312]|uniref:RWD domain-containing protein n=1 Tax=Ophiocordyceps polyrhachis-furcata BCC 54312 TaxID=1330021 RepID=A0A367L0J7_9HYPO|nr:hypothetical protein L249_5866 [Ophiocordyceps polyrhachis-furcata BCC 54312]
MPREAQLEEREVLESIFPDEITHMSETDFRITVSLDAPDPSPPPPRLLLHVRYPEDYPDVAPQLDLLAHPDDDSHHPYLSVANDRQQLLAGLEPIIQESIGIAMVFTLVSSLREAAEALVQKRIDDEADIRQEALLAAEREENNKFHGTPVTPDTFHQWRRAFRTEMEEQHRRDEEDRLAELKRAKIKEPVKLLTGRQLWERGLAGKGDDDEDDNDNGDSHSAVPTKRLEKLQVEPS